MQGSSREQPGPLKPTSEGDPVLRQTRFAHFPQPAGTHRWPIGSTPDEPIEREWRERRRGAGVVRVRWVVESRLGILSGPGASDPRASQDIHWRMTIQNRNDRWKSSEFYAVSAGFRVPDLTSQTRDPNRLLNINQLDARDGLAEVLDTADKACLWN